jgi:hypothetical protein
MQDITDGTDLKSLPIVYCADVIYILQVQSL